MKLLLYLFGVTFHSNTVVALELRECSHQLGMSNRKIRDEQISASSSFDLQSTGPQHARAHQESGSGAWCPKNQINSLSKEWLQISFSVDTVITSVETQGRFDDGRGMEYATAFKIQYWRPSLNAWASYKDDFELETIPANNDTEHAIRRHLDRAIIARRIRIVPVSNSTRTVCMRVEVFGCPFDDSLVFYNVDQGDLQSGISYHDFSYDGNLANSPHLTGGIGKLYDGEVGKNNVFVNHHKWVGWRRKRNGNVKLAFEFSELRNISGILIHTSNEFKKSAKAFSSATVLFSINGKDFSDTIVHFNNPEDTESEVPRWIRIPVNNRIAKVAKIRLNFGTDSDWLFISEVNFESNHTNIELLNDDVVIPDSVSYFSVTEHDDGTSMFAFIIFFFMFLIVAVIILTVLYRKREYRVKASSPSPNAKREILLTIDGNTIKHHVSPSTYQMARDNLQNALIEKMPMSPIISDYAEPDISVCSDVTANTPLLYGIDGPYDTQKRSNPLSSMVKYSDYGEVYCTTLPEIARDKLICVSRIGQGEFGEVDLCQLENRKVAVKKLHGISQADEFSFHREIRVLGSLKHPNVVEVVGVCTIQKPILCIMEYMENGDLKSYILKNPTIQTSQCISICTQLAAGLAYLESCNFVHRDIAARNCLVDGEGNVKIADFGMARSLYSQEYYKVEGKFVLPIRWMAWEALLLGKFSTASDVWGFGVTMWEIFSLCSEKPYSDMTDDDVVENLQSMSSTGSLKQVLSRPRMCPSKLYNEQILPCWNYESSRRPSFENVHLHLQSLVHTSPHIHF
ncbi:Discoidin domain-containing receptor tyrosine kinase B [Caenorhabditis elegans]|uniref:Discoidin domain-containing receptor tyrosine kinase B n=2 Tax=Caenorhabditis elegans TaxID=6239 RepID=DDRB_CAEEL|nr:Discoidin domain-containing receptor tyrosine kinase B [Caenorhabditis elegans]Q95ZV7.1 RecName: Full=Discoidin domain-containing receptor tyrosine kinase B; AltName: Full=Discoidin domain-containing receptor B; Flags: Precursor [Caenorhabditis elegans]CCD69233.1 Discoidin domain-containing receptor tyrosine kinase B [Caenorhabditis elegans]|eukprot:NP_508572.1 Discoidin domain-containing receptor tyrosine kinase B [Caenorhabditis elegans]